MTEYARASEPVVTNGAARECFVVCVDDDAEFVKSLELFLPERIRERDTKGPAPRFLFFTDPRDALDSLSEIVSEEEPLAMVISDQQMPQMKGTAFLARIREQYPECVRVLLTGHAGLESAIAAINERLLDKYLTKPVENEHDFTVSIDLLLQRFWMLRTNRIQSAELEKAYGDSQAKAVALAAANERLRLLDRLKDDFLNFVSHELRTPLTVLSGVEFLEPDPKRPDQAELVGALRGGYERMQHFVETALEYGKWIAGERSKRIETVNLAEVVQSAARRIPGLGDRAPDVTLELTDLPCFVQGNPTDLAEAVSILCANADKFCERGKPIRVSCEVEEGKVVLAIEDRGVGFAPELAEELLRPFTIADSLHHGSGSALHLAKASAIAAAHGGELHAMSPGPGLGATFTLRLPLADPNGLPPDESPLVSREEPRA